MLSYAHASTVVRWLVLVMLLLAAPRTLAAGDIVLIVAHRGASFDAPENTMAAFNLAWEQNADAIEGDFHLTADGQIVCIHDFNANRVAGVDRKIADMTLAEVQQLDVGRWKAPAFAGERAPALAEVLQSLPEGKLFFIEIKCGPEIMPALKNSLQAHKARWNGLRIISFDDRVIEAVKRELPLIKAFWLTSFKKWKDDSVTLSDGDVLSMLDRLKADGLDVKADLPRLNDAFLKQLREKNYPWHTWTVDDPAVAQAVIDRGVKSITTNRPGFLREVLPPASLKRSR